MSDGFKEKIRLILVAKRENLLGMSLEDEDGNIAESDKDVLELQGWVQRQVSFRLSLEHESEEFCLAAAKTLIKVYGDEILAELYAENQSLSELELSEKLLDEILHDMKVHQLRSLGAGDMFGEQAPLREGTRTASVRCTEDTHLAYVGRDDFLKIYTNIMKVRYDKRI